MRRDHIVGKLTNKGGIQILLECRDIRYVEPALYVFQNNINALMTRLIFVCIAAFLIGCADERNTDEQDKPIENIGLSHEKAAAIHSDHMRTYSDISLQDLTSLIGTTTYATGSGEVDGKKVYSYSIKTTVYAEGSEPDFIEVKWC